MLCQYWLTQFAKVGILLISGTIFCFQNVFVQAEWRPCQFELCLSLWRVHFSISKSNSCTHSRENKITILLKFKIQGCETLVRETNEVLKTVTPICRHTCNYSKLFLKVLHFLKKFSKRSHFIFGPTWPSASVNILVLWETPCSFALTCSCSSMYTPMYPLVMGRCSCAAYVLRRIICTFTSWISTKLADFPNAPRDFHIVMRVS
jgi:hypothetical protein